MCLNQAQGPKLDENCLDNVPYSKSIGNDRCTTCSQAPRSLVPRPHLSHEEKSLGQAP